MADAMKSVLSERVFVSVASGLWGHPLMGALENEVGTVKWKCQHRHVKRSAALVCAEKQRRRWIMSGRGRI